MNSTSNNLFWLSYSSTHINELSSPSPQKTTTVTTHTHTEQRKKPKKRVNEDTKDSFSDPLFLLLMPVLMNSTPDCPFLSFWQITFLIVCKWSTHQRLLFWLLTNYPFIHVHFHVKKHHQKKKTPNTTLVSETTFCWFWGWSFFRGCIVFVHGTTFSWLT